MKKKIIVCMGILAALLWIAVGARLLLRAPHPGMRLHYTAGVPASSPHWSPDSTMDTGRHTGADSLSSFPCTATAAGTHTTPGCRDTTVPAASHGATTVPGAAEDTSTTAGASGPGTPDCIDVNTAPAARLQTLHGIGPVLAQRICAYRTQHGVFLVADDLKKVKGIGPVTVERIRADICFSSR